MCVYMRRWSLRSTVFSILVSLSLSLSQPCSRLAARKSTCAYPSIYIYIYIHMCVCACIRVRGKGRPHRPTHPSFYLCIADSINANFKKVIVNNTQARNNNPKDRVHARAPMRVGWRVH